MKEQSIIEVGESRPAWEALEAYAREGNPARWRGRAAGPAG
jgi:hypothetical protein